MTDMAVEWDYTRLAQSYEHRPGYPVAIWSRFVEISGLASDARIVDVGAGTGKLARMLAKRGYRVIAVEPNEAMAAIGRRKTEQLPLTWLRATAEDTSLPDRSFDAATFASSFNVVDRVRALREVARVLVPGGWFVCLWNHRELDDPLQRAIERTIRRFIPDFAYGTRREDQRPILEASGLFSRIHYFDARFRHRFTAGSFRKAWRSHATLLDQAGPRAGEVLSAIDHLVGSASTVHVGYVTRAWAAQLID